MKKTISNIRLIVEWLWLQFRAKFVKMTAEKPCLMLLPCEPWTVVGSRGDEAMITAIVQDFKKRHPEGRAIILVARSSFPESEEGRRLSTMLGVDYVFAWGNGRVLNNIFGLLRSCKVTEFYALGADCMDGYWSFFISFLLLSTSDLAARIGIASRLTAFSFNEKPNRLLIPLFRLASSKLTILVRDPVSYCRFISRVGKLRNVLSVADVAFCLNPKFSDRVNALLSEMKSLQDTGKIVVGFNLHPMLVSEDELPNLVATVSKQLNEFLAKTPKAVLYLIPHDYRPQGDMYVLQKICEQVQASHYVTDILSAAELKALTSGLNVLFTSRMHLGIAALGMGKPIGSFSYQGKFTGLFRLFGLSDEFVISPKECVHLAKIMASMCMDVMPIANSIIKYLPSVLENAHKNLLK